MLRTGVNSCMNNDLLRKQLYSSLLTIIQDKNCYYQSPVNKEYNYFLEEGKDAIIEWLELLAPVILAHEEKDLDITIKTKVWKNLKE